VVTAATWNVNLDDAAPTAWTYFLWADWVRKSAIGKSNTVDMWTIAFADFTSLLGKLGKFGSRPSDLLWIFNQNTLVKSMEVAEFANQYINGKTSTVNTGAITNILWTDVFTAYDFNLTEADWKISTTAWNNTKGWVALIHRDAVQYWYSWDYQVEIFRAPWKGWQILGYYYMGVGIADTIAWNTEPTIALGINATV
jgi:hypothetical protein